MAKLEPLREANPYGLVKKEEVPSNFISGDQLISLFKKNGISEPLLPITLP